MFKKSSPNYSGKIRILLLLSLFSCNESNPSTEINEDQIIEIDSTDWKQVDLSFSLKPIDSLFTMNADSIPVDFLNLLNISKPITQNYIHPDSCNEIHGLKIYFLKEKQRTSKQSPITTYYFKAFDNKGWLVGAENFEFVGKEVKTKIIASTYLQYSNNYIGDFYSGEGAWETKDSIARYEYFYISENAITSIDEIALPELKFLRSELLSTASGLLPEKITPNETELIDQMDRLLKNK